jgi:uncharacterized protein YukE
MAKSLIDIQMDFNKAKSQANRLDEIAKELTQIADSQLGGVLSGVNSAWKSDTASEYIKKGKTVQDQLKKRANELTKTATSIRTIAQNTYNAEMKAYRLAKTRTYKG